MMKLKRRQLAKYLDHTMLKPEATATMIDQTVAEAIKYQTASVCINPYWVKRVHQKLSETGINTCTVIGFPLGATTTASKVFEAQQAVRAVSYTHLLSASPLLARILSIFPLKKPTN